MTTFSIDELMPAGAVSGGIRARFARSAKAVPASKPVRGIELLLSSNFMQPPSGVFLCVGCKPQELIDPHNPPAGVEGPYTIVGK